MNSKLRHIKKYTPRRRRASQILQKQQLKDFEHLLAMDLGTLIILSKEGTLKQVEQARAKLLRDLLRYGADLETIGRDLGEGFPEMIRNYLKTMKDIAKNKTTAIDDAVVEQARKQALLLKKKVV